MLAADGARVGCNSFSALGCVLTGGSLTYRVSPTFDGHYLLAAKFRGTTTTQPVTLQIVPPGSLYGANRDQFSVELAVGSEQYNVFQALLEELHRLKLCPVAEAVWGLDGVQYELEISAGFHRSVYSWWGELPTQWVSLGPVIRKLEGLIARPITGV